VNAELSANSPVQQGDYSVIAGWIQLGDQQRGAVSGTIRRSEQLPTTASTTTTTAPATRAATTVVSRTVSPAPKINPSALAPTQIAPALSSTTTTAKASTTTKVSNPTAVTLTAAPTFPTLTVLPKPITPHDRVADAGAASARRDRQDRRFVRIG
jgi:hypothetical protein